MKKLIFMLLFAGSLFAQNLDKPSLKEYNEKELINKVIDNTVEGMRVAAMHVSFMDSLSVDTVRAADTTVVSRLSTIYDFRNAYQYNAFKVYNAGSDADTVKFENFSKAGNKYTNTVQLIDESTNTAVTDATLLIINASAEKSYKITGYAGKVKLSTKVATGQKSDRVRIEFLGVN